MMDPYTSLYTATFRMNNPNKTSSFYKTPNQIISCCFMNKVSSSKNLFTSVPNRILCHSMNQEDIKQISVEIDLILKML